MDRSYADTVRFLLDITPAVFANDIFGMKGGTAINLFLQDMPRLSVDIDVVYLPWKTPRKEALEVINDELSEIAARIQALGAQTRLIPSRDLSDTKLIADNGISQVKIEVNVVFRGTVLPVENYPLSQTASDLFGTELEAPILSREELYASKIVAALDRQHPRDLFDIWRLYESGGVNEMMIECFVIYLAGHNRPPHELLFGHDKDLSTEYVQAFIGMTELNCTLQKLIDTRVQLRKDLVSHLNDQHKSFLVSLLQIEPAWSLLKCAHAAQLPALRWKLRNLELFRKARPTDFETQAQAMIKGLSNS